MNTVTILITVILPLILVGVSGFVTALFWFVPRYSVALQLSYPELDLTRVPTLRIISVVLKIYFALARRNFKRCLELEKSLVEEFGGRCTSDGECNLTAGEVEEMARREGWDGYDGN